jgi:hypothetical protein
MRQRQLMPASVCQERSQIMLTDRLVNGFAAQVIGRWTDYAVQRADGRYVRVGQHLTPALVGRHLAGELTIGTYVVDELGRCGYAVFDADQADGLVVLAGVQARLAEAGIPSVLEASRRGGHLWVLLEMWVPAAWVRAQMQPYCPVGVELYPKQDALSGAGFGSLIRVPLGVHRLTGRRYPLVLWHQGRAVPVAGPSEVAAQVRWLRAQGGWRVWPLPHPLPLATPARPAPGASMTQASARHDAAPWPTIAAWCAAHDPLAVIGRYVALDRRGLGCCPFGEHHSDGKDTHPSLRVYQPTKPGGTCWHCYTWGQGGSLFDFLRRYHGLAARTLWARIRAGEGF